MYMMTSWVRIWFVVFITLLISNWQSFVCGEPQVPCYFIFGDSLFDNGNNNDLNTTAKVNYRPYGIDFPLGPTGRFCNGRTSVDIIAQLLGFENFIPPFATASGEQILQGVNYASGGAGIRDDTGMNLGARISFTQQLINHQTTISRIAQLLGNESSSTTVTDYLNKCIYTVGFGSNDYINNYFLPNYYPTSTLYTLDEYAVALMQQYSLQLSILYTAGARKVSIFGLGNIGCAPKEMADFGTNYTCVGMMDSACQIFNAHLVSLVDSFNDLLPDAQFIYINSSGMAATGFTDVSTPCCSVTDELCEPMEVTCSNRSEYVFWDGVHPTEAYNLITGGRAYGAEYSTDAYPTDIRGLVISNETDSDHQARPRQAM
ncbi:GDSL esterase/lipase At1g29670-like [Cornus florida]|uniref:GDSL esterase/lipase At1g29670-like n=1 Tax=Cornus florida TaxID=4283 RepID=UPI00289D7ADF|nr:GDSL esterase/lipase At1g29670-like [Cornus florida]